METQEGYLDPKCPRCGYDQSGEAATWEDACPIEGTCPECGHGFGWADVFDPSRSDLPWFVEHAHSKRSMMRRTFPMLLMLARPRTAWRRIGVHTRNSTGKCFAWSAVFCLLLHTGLSLGSFVLEIVAKANSGRLGSMAIEDWVFFFASALSMPFAGLVNYGNGIEPYWFPHMFVPAPFAMALGFSLLWLILMQLLPSARRVARIKREHVWRASVYSFVGYFIAIQMQDAWVMVQSLASQAGASRGARQLLIDLMRWTRWILLIWMVWWWWSALTVGWKLRMWHPVLILCTIASVLAAFVAAILFDFDGVTRFWGRHF